jgi:hypothetical protein
MTESLETRETPFTDAEFDALPRNADGDIINLSMAYPFITTEQRERLSDDDWSRMDDLDEEMRYLYAEAREEFGL